MDQETEVQEILMYLYTKSVNDRTMIPRVLPTALCPRKILAFCLEMAGISRESLKIKEALKTFIFL